MLTDEALIDREVKAAAKDGKLACATAFKVAERLGVPPREIGDAANRVGVKIMACQLGCFQ